MENNVEVRADTGLRTACWPTAAVAASGPGADPFNAAIAGYSQANLFKDQECDFFQDLFDGMVQQFGREPSTQASPGDRTPIRDGSTGTHAAFGKTDKAAGKTDSEPDTAGSVDDVNHAAGVTAVPKTSRTEKSQEKTEVTLESSEVNGLNIDSLGARIKKSGKYTGYQKTEYGYVQTDPAHPGPDYLLLIDDPQKMTDQQKHFM
jgi:hypothetical protein